MRQNHDLRNKKSLAVFGLGLFIILTVIAVFFLRFRNGIVLEAKTEYSSQVDTVLYRQDDENWEQDKLGESEYTMESSGCLVTCIAAAATMNGNEVTPGELNKLFSEKQVYDTEGNLQWEKVGEIEEYEVEVYSEVSNQIIEECLQAGRYPIVRVRMMGIGNFHYVLIVGSKEGKYLCMDPLQNELTSLSEYGNRVYAIRCVWYEKSEEIALYEAYYHIEHADGDYLYTYFDCDDDGKLELLMRERDAKDISMYIMKYEKNGLRYTYDRDYDDICAEELQWYDASENEWKEKKSGIYVDVVNSTPMEHYWYLEKESFLKDFGFTEAEPFYEYTDIDGNLYMTLYYNEQTEAGCGIIYSEYGSHHGFVFHEISEGIWEGTRDYFALESVYGDDGKSEIDEDYQEEYEYDSAGRMTHFESSGFCDWYGDGSERLSILKFDFVYDENGHLKQRHYQHGGWLFGSWCRSWDSYFDDLERIEYENIYITHGSQEKFYIYSDNSQKPDYVLMVDIGWDLEFVKY